MRRETLRAHLEIGRDGDYSRWPLRSRGWLQPGPRSLEFIRRVDTCLPKLIGYRVHMAQRLRVLLTNDDGWSAEGLRCLHENLSRQYDVTVVAPEEEQSGVGHGFTFSRALHCRPIPPGIGMVGYVVAGTPCDCVKFGVSRVLREKPDLVVSGMNAGENTGVAAFYSGTVAAAREGAFWRIASVAVSVAADGVMHLSAYSRMAVGIIERIRRLYNERCSGATLDRRVFFNVNFPGCAPDKCKGVRVVRQSMAFFDDRYEPLRDGSDSMEYYLRGDRVETETDGAFDTCAMMSGYAAICPLMFDATAVEILGCAKVLEEGGGNLLGEGS